MAVTLTGTEVEVYSGEVMHEYQTLDMFGSVGMKYRAATAAEVINQPVVTPGDAKHIDDGSAHNNEDASIASKEVPLFVPIKASNKVKKSQVDVRPDLNLLENLGQSHGKSLGEGKTIRLLNFLAKVAYTANNIITADFDATDGTAPANTKEAFKALGREMDLNSVPATGRHVMLASDPWYELADQDGVMSRDFGGQANRQTAGGVGAIIDYLNFPIKNCPLGFGIEWGDTAYDALDLPAALEFDMREVVGVAWHSDSWMLRQQVAPLSTIDWIADDQVWLVLSRMHMGCKELLTDGIFVLMES